MIRYKEVLEKPLDYIQNQPGFKKNKKISKLAGFLTLGLAILLFGVARPLIYLYISGDFAGINVPLVAASLTLFIGLVVVLFKLFISHKLTQD